MTFKCGIVGFGKMGALHAKGYKMAGVEVVGIIDANATESLYPVYDDFQMLLEDVDIVSICSPSSTHFDFAIQSIQAGIPVLVEKPLAMTLEQCRIIKKLSIDNAVLVSVGHIERFNTGLVTCLEYLRQGDSIGTITKVEALRTNPSSNRISDADVISDLTVHDLDILYSICGGDRVQDISVHAYNSNAETGLIDAISCDAVLNGIRIELHTSRVSDTACRTITVHGTKGVIAVNLLKRSMTVNGQAVAVTPSDQIDDELGAWVSAVKHNTPPVVTVDDGIFVVQASEDIRSIIKG